MDDIYNHSLRVKMEVKKVKKLLSMLLVIVMALGCFAACGASETEAPAATEAPTPAPVATEAPTPAPTETPAEPVTIRIGGQKGPTSMGMVKMLKDSENGLTENKYEYVLDTADALNAALIKGDLDVVGISANAISILNANTKGEVLLCGINALGCNYFLENGEEITDLESLKGKTIYSVGKGLTPEYCMAHIFELYGMDLYTDVNIIWKEDATEIVSLLATEPGAIGMLPEPLATTVQMQVPTVRIAVDLVEAWEAKDTESKFILAGLAVRKEFAEEHPEALQAFLEDYAASTNYVNENPAEGAVLIEEYGLFKAAVAQKAIPTTNLVCITGAEMKDVTEAYLQILFDQSASAVGGAMPAEDFYWIYG